MKQKILNAIKAAMNNKHEFTIEGVMACYLKQNGSSILEEQVIAALKSFIADGEKILKVSASLWILNTLTRDEIIHTFRADVKAAHSKGNFTEDMDALVLKRNAALAAL